MFTFYIVFSQATAAAKSMPSALVSSVPSPANRKQPMVGDSDQNKKDEQGNDHYFLQE